MDLRGALTRNWPLKLTALLLSIMLWVVAAAEEPGSKAVRVEVSLRPPAGRAVTSAPPPITAIVVGPRRELFQLTSARVLLTPAAPIPPTERRARFELSPSDVILPRGSDLHVQALYPRRIELELDSLHERTVPVRPAVLASADSGFDLLGAITLTPSRVRIAGPRDQVTRIDTVRTQPLDLDRLDGATELRVAIDTAPLGVVRVTPSSVTAVVDLQPAASRRLGPVPVRLTGRVADAFRVEPETVTVTARGPLSRLAELDAASVVATLPDDAAAGTAEVRLFGPAGLSLESEPARVTLRPRSRGE